MTSLYPFWCSNGGTLKWKIAVKQTVFSKLKFKISLGECEHTMGSVITFALTEALGPML